MLGKPDGSTVAIVRASARLDGFTTVACRVRRDDPFAIVTVRGTLAFSSAPLLRTNLLKCVAECPAAVLVDLARLVVSQPASLAVFGAVLRQAATWSGVPLLLCRVPPRISRLLASRRGGADLPLFATLAAARRAAADPAAQSRRVQADLAPTRDAPARGRLMVTDACRRWRLEHLAPTAELIVSELCANVVVHAGTRMRIVLTRGAAYLHLVVRDDDPRLPARIPGRLAEPWRVGGRGLALVEALASGWGAVSTARGKAVWATLSIGPGRS
jgi:anti-anti-sigma regulatory factor